MFFFSHRRVCNQGAHETTRPRDHLKKNTGVLRRSQPFSVVPSRSQSFSVVLSRSQSFSVVLSRSQSFSAVLSRSQSLPVAVPPPKKKQMTKSFAFGHLCCVSLRSSEKLSTSYLPLPMSLCCRADLRRSQTLSTPRFGPPTRRSWCSYPSRSYAQTKSLWSRRLLPCRCYSS